MRFSRLSACVCLLLCASFASCAGGGGLRTAPAIPAPESGSDLQRQTFTLGTNGAQSGAVTLRSNAAMPASAVTLESGSCGEIPAITIVNPFPVALRIAVEQFTVRLACKPQNALFGATFYQVKPQPVLVAPIKLADATVADQALKFTPHIQTLTLAPKSISRIIILPETSIRDVGFPVAPGSTTELTSGSSDLPSGLNFRYQTASGGKFYTVACFDAFDSSGHLAQALQGVPLVGIPSFYCHVQPLNGNIAFGDIVTFTVTAPKPDRAIFEPDGDAQGFACTESSQCNVPSFSIPATYQNFIEGNVQDLRVRTLSTTSGNFSVLVEDDPTYKPGTETSPVPWDGKFRINLSGPCALNTEDAQNETGPNAEFGIRATGTGVCKITVSEDPRYIIDYTDPENPQPRSASVSITVSPSGG
jgi:hypothetical protein